METWEQTSSYQLQPKTISMFFKYHPQYLMYLHAVHVKPQQQWVSPCVEIRSGQDHGDLLVLTPFTEF